MTSLNLSGEQRIRYNGRFYSPSELKTEILRTQTLRCIQDAELAYLFEKGVIDTIPDARDPKSAAEAAKIALCKLARTYCDNAHGECRNCPCIHDPILSLSDGRDACKVASEYTDYVKKLRMARVRVQSCETYRAIAIEQFKKVEMEYNKLKDEIEGYDKKIKLHQEEVCSAESDLEKVKDLYL